MKHTICGVLLVSLLVGAALLVPAQTTVPVVSGIQLGTWPDIFTPGAAYTTAGTNWILQVQGNDNALAGQANQSVAAIQDLQARVAALEAKLQPAPPPPAPASSYALSVSTSADRSNAVNLNGATVSGSVYIFTSKPTNFANSAPAGISSLCYWLDNTAASGTAAHCEGSTPYDFQGGVAAAAFPWSTSAIPNGAHTITQKIVMASGANETDIASFTVAN